MNFFKSILADDDDDDDDLNSPISKNNHESGGNSSATAPRGDGNSDGWSFGDLIKTLSAQSELVIETYRKDLQEFGLGLRKESEIFRDTASRAVKDLPASLEATASAAHVALDGVLKSTADIIAKESSLFSPDREPETPETNRSIASGRYSWYEAQLSAIQNDLNTFREEPENAEEYGKWKSGFELEDYKDEIEYLIGEGGTMESIYKKIVLNEVDQETFWCRYFYRVDKLKQQERVRANLMQRAISVNDDNDDDELTWDVDDEEDGNRSDLAINERAIEGREMGDLNAGENQEDGSKDVKEVGMGDLDDGEKNVVVDDLGSTEEKEGKLEGAVDGKREEEVARFEEAAGGERKEEVKSEEVAGVENEEKVKSEEEGVKETSDEKVGVEEKGELGIGNDGLVVSSHGVVEKEEDMGWDEIGDMGSDDDDKKALGNAAADGGDADKAELRKQLSAVDDDDDDEDMSWDIEDDDETVKA